jgi:hypothetical protein
LDQQQQQQQQHKEQVHSGLLGRDLPLALPQTPSGSSSDAGRLVAVGFGPCDLAEDDQWENVRTWLIQVRPWRRSPQIF